MTLKEKIQVIQDKDKRDIETRDFYIAKLEKELRNIGVVITKKNGDNCVLLHAFLFLKDKRVAQQLNFNFNNNCVKFFLGRQTSTHRYNENDFNLMMDILASYYSSFVSFEQ